MSPYETVICRVESVDTVNKKVKITPLTSRFLETINEDAGGGLKFATNYSTYYDPVDPTKVRLNSTGCGSVSYPQKGETVVALINMVDRGPIRGFKTAMAQDETSSVIILARISMEHPAIGPYDHLIADHSGAKIHFNHGWLDSTNVKTGVPDYQEEGSDTTTYQLKTGHMTWVANRSVRLAGQKFLPFGMFSHLLGQGDGKTDEVVVIPAQSSDEAEVPAIKWKDLFTLDPTEGNLYDDLLSKAGGSGGKKFLQPPCPPPGTMMDCHDSGYKRLVENDGQLREYCKSKVVVVGDDGSDKAKKTAFDPIGMDEKNAVNYPDEAVGVLMYYFLSGSNTLTIKFDAGSTKVVITGDLEVTGEVKGGTGTFG